MSDESLEQKTATKIAPTPEKRRATIPEIIKHQQSFEKRYSHIIQRQILETSINMDALHRQMTAFLSFSKSPPKSLESEVSQATTNEQPCVDESEKAAVADVLEPETDTKSVKQPATKLKECERQTLKVPEHACEKETPKVPEHAREKEISKVTKNVLETKAEAKPVKQLAMKFSGKSFDKSLELKAAAKPMRKPLMKTNERLFEKAATLDIADRSDTSKK